MSLNDINLGCVSCDVLASPFLHIFVVAFKRVCLPSKLFSSIYYYVTALKACDCTVVRTFFCNDTGVKEIM